MFETIIDGVLKDKEDITKIIYKINDKLILNSEKEMYNKVIELVKDGYNINNIIVTKDGSIYLDEFNRTIQEIIKIEFL